MRMMHIMYFVLYKTVLPPPNALKERINAIKRMLQANAVKEQILSYGYTEEEFIKAQNSNFIQNA